MNRRLLIVLTLAIVASFSVLQIESAWARAGGGTSSGSRGSRSTVAPSKPAPATPRPADPSPVVSPSPMAPRPSPFGGFMGALGGFMLGGLLGGLLFGGLGHGFGGIGMLDLLLIGGGIALLVMFMRRRAQSPEPAYAGASAGRSTSGATVEVPASVSDLERGVDHIRQMDQSFDPDRFAATARSMFLAVQDAIGRRDLGGIRDSLTTEMLTTLQTQCDELRQARHTNRMARIDVRRAEVSEAWQETGQDFVTVYLAGEMLDWVVDDATGAVVEGSDRDPQPFEEYWTFVRPVGPSRFRLTAIQQG
jgi:predicted lipid-binding transport protein (Tim44 family)